jgi:hypothetical protein
MTVTSDRVSPAGPAKISPAAYRTTFGERMWYRYALLIGPLIGWYMLFDKAGAYVRIPGTPLYIGECMVVLGIVATIWATSYFRLSITRDPLLMLLFVFMAWGAIRAAPQISKYHTNTFRDSALWYYALFAVFFTAASQVDPTLPARIVSGLRRFVPVVLIWLPIDLVMQRVHNIPIRVPFSPVTILLHRGGNLGVVSAICLATVWLLPDPKWSRRTRMLLTFLALGTILLVGTQSRAGFGAACLVILIGMIGRFVPHSSRLLGRLALITVGVLVVGLLGAVGISTVGKSGNPNGRSFSVSQLVANIASVGGYTPSNDAGNLSGALSFRGNLETTILKKQFESDTKIVYGFGFGPNLAALAGVESGKAQGGSNQDLRGPHNSHLDVLARMGIFGGLMWAVFWFLWYRRVLKSRRRLKNDGFHPEQHTLEVLFLGVTAVLINCAFDPTLEGAQVAALLWTMTGLGLLLSGRNGAGMLSRVENTDDLPRYRSALRRGTPAKLPRLAYQYED